MKFKQNYTGISEQGGGFVLPDEDWYHVRIDKTEGQRSKAGDPQVMVSYTIVQGEETHRAFVGASLREYRTFTEKGRGFNKHFLKLIGQPHDEQFSVDTDAWIGAQVWVKVVHEEYNGKMYAKICAYKPLDEMNDTPESEGPDFKDQ